jgi:hypothetical protein
LPTAFAATIRKETCWRRLRDWQTAGVWEGLLAQRQIVKRGDVACRV